MKNQKIKLEKFQSAVHPYLLASLFLAFLSNVVFSADFSAESAEAAGCSFISSLDDWRVTAFLGLILGIVVIGFMYMYGSVIDDSFIKRAKNEFYQIVFSGIILVFFTFIVSFMCSNFVAEMFNSQVSTYAGAESYLVSLSSFLGNSAMWIAIGSSALKLGSSIEIKGYSTASSTFAYLSDPLSYLSDAFFMFYGVVLGAYLLTAVQLNVLKILPYLCLYFLVPIGLVLRTMFPFRKFGGGLMGVGIGLYVFIPFLLLLNSAMVGEYLRDSKLESFKCLENSDCYSHICQLDQQAGYKKCLPMRSDGETCEINFQCKSGLCLDSSNGKICSACGGPGSTNPHCCEGFVRNSTSGLCEIAKVNGELCINNGQCISGLCLANSSGTLVCTPKKWIGENCTQDFECISRSCGGILIKICKKTTSTEDDVSQVMSSQIASIRSSPSSQFDVFGVQSRPTFNYVSSDQLISSAESEINVPAISYFGNLINSILDPIIISFIAGIVLPILNLSVISKGVKDLSSALGSEMDIASIWKLV